MSERKVSIHCPVCHGRGDFALLNGAKCEHCHGSGRNPDFYMNLPETPDVVGGACFAPMQAADARPGTPLARLEWLLKQLAARFPKAEEPYSSSPCEPRYLAAIDILLAERGADARPVAIYQVRFKGQFKWLDVEQAGYDLRQGEEYERRIVYAIRDAARKESHGSSE